MPFQNRYGIFSWNSLAGRSHSFHPSTWCIHYTLHKRCTASSDSSVKKGRRRERKTPSKRKGKEMGQEIKASDQILLFFNLWFSSRRLSFSERQRTVKKRRKEESKRNFLNKIRPFPAFAFYSMFVWSGYFRSAKVFSYRLCSTQSVCSKGFVFSLTLHFPQQDASLFWRWRKSTLHVLDDDTGTHTHIDAVVPYTTHMRTLRKTEI